MRGKIYGPIEVQIKMVEEVEVFKILALVS